MKRLCLFLLIASMVGHYCHASNQIVLYAKPESVKDQRNEYFIALLTLALSKTNNQINTIQLQRATRPMQQGRAIVELAQNRGIDVIWSVTSLEREKQLLPIRIPLLKGLLGYRVAIIRAADKDKFAAVTSIENLRKLSAGQGHDWPDTKILIANKIRVMTSSTYSGLFAMLENKRFDFFPRGVTEAWQELAMLKNPKLLIEDSLLFYYPSPIYFFVNKMNQILANRIEEGLKHAIDDGSFEQLFISFPEHKKMFASVNIKQRKLITLFNPLLPPLTPLDNNKLWFQFK
ncbi:MAG: hypothetical protein JKY14_02195 [Paraglaciecola sp.]|nr:hypothetical protein [Paraglaciecola sp.]